MKKTNDELATLVRIYMEAVAKVDDVQARLDNAEADRNDAYDPLVEALKDRGLKRLICGGMMFVVVDSNNKYDHLRVTRAPLTIP